MILSTTTAERDFAFASPCSAFASSRNLEMRNVPRIAAMFVAALLLIASPAASQTFSLCHMLGISCFGDGCGSGCGCGDCGCEPSCGCPSGCGMSGRPYAGQGWVGGGCNGCATSD